MPGQMDQKVEDGSLQSANSSKVTATAALVMFLSFVGIVALLHFLRHDLPPLSTFISDYATGPFGFLMTGAFLALGIGIALLNVALATSSPLDSRPWPAMILLSVAAALMLLVAIYPSDPPGSAPTRTGAIHDQVSGLFFLVMMAVMLSLSIRLWRAGLLAGLYWALVVLSIAAPILLVVAFYLLDSVGLVGLGQRIYVLSLLSWLILMALGMREGSFSK